MIPKTCESRKMSPGKKIFYLLLGMLLLLSGIQHRTLQKTGPVLETAAEEMKAGEPLQAVFSAFLQP